jgi:predicted MPP superfamily phosphohydrolase
MADWHATAYGIGALACAGLVLVLWAVLVEPRLLAVRRIVLPSDELGLPPLRILHLTDTHFHGRDETILKLLRRLAAEDFDLVFFTGDMIDNEAGLESLTEAAGLFRPRIGALAVLAGHDYMDYSSARPRMAHTLGLKTRTPPSPNPVEEVRRRMREQGVQLLEDSHVLLDSPDGARLAVVGLPDAYVFEPDYEAAWRGLPDGVPVIVIAHSPDVLPEVAARGAALAFFGHTHGGQVRLPLIGAVVTHTRLPRRLARGLFRTGGTVFAVNTGAGTSTATHVRLLCRPEVIVTELRPSAHGAGFTPVREARLD